MTGPKPSGPSHPRPTHPPKQTADASIMPTIGMVIRDGERLGAQLLAILDRGIDPASLPADPGHLAQIDATLRVAGYHVGQALQFLGDLAAVPLPPVGSVPRLPARQDPDALSRASSVATTGGPERPGGPPASGASTTLGYLGPAMSCNDGRYAADAPAKRHNAR